uniref:Uncharacterized protein MANES_12G047900 n=1 Tax=Rhizophora mucronata TaxID=61149 RepID=A0A2P2LUM9_RHIMU
MRTATTIQVSFLFFKHLLVLICLLMEFVAQCFIHLFYP